MTIEKYEKLLQKYEKLLQRIYECPDVMFTIDSNDRELADEIERVLEEANS